MTECTGLLSAQGWQFVARTGLLQRQWPIESLFRKLFSTLLSLGRVYLSGGMTSLRKFCLAWDRLIRFRKLLLTIRTGLSIQWFWCLSSRVAEKLVLRFGCS